MRITVNPPKSEWADLLRRPQIDAPVAAHGEKVVIALVVVPDEEVFCIGRRIGKRYGRKICHIVSRRVLGDLKGHAPGPEIVIGFLLGHGMFLLGCSGDFALL